MVLKLSVHGGWDSCESGSVTACSNWYLRQLGCQGTAGGNGRPLVLFLLGPECAWTAVSWDHKVYTQQSGPLAFYQLPPTSSHECRGVDCIVFVDFTFLAVSMARQDRCEHDPLVLIRAKEDISLYQNDQIGSGKIGPWAEPDTWGLLFVKVELGRCRDRRRLTLAFTRLYAIWFFDIGSTSLHCETSNGEVSWFHDGRCDG